MSGEMYGLQMRRHRNEFFAWLIRFVLKSVWRGILVAYRAIRRIPSSKERSHEAVRKDIVRIDRYRRGGYGGSRRSSTIHRVQSR